MPDTQIVFISYNQADRAWAEWIAWILEEDGFHARIQAWDFQGNFVLEMDQAAKEAEQTIIVLSKDYLSANFPQPEWAAAFAQDPTSKSNKLIPVRVGEVALTGLLAQINYVDFVGKDEDAAKERLIARVRGLRGKPPVKPLFPGKPAHPVKPVFPSARSTAPRVWNMPYARNPNFTGRQAILDELTTRLESGERAALVQSIAGLGGIGKTQIAIEYVYRRLELYDVVWWVRAGEPTTLDIDFAALADALSLPVKQLSEQLAIIEAVRRWLDQNKGWLLVFDNAEDQNTIATYLPRNGQGQVIITSRNPAWGGLAQNLTVKEMTSPEARDFLVGGESPVDDGGHAVDLADELGCLPLALAHAKAYMDETGTGLNDYLNLFKEQRRKLLADARALDYPVSVAATWQMSFSAAQTRNASSNDFAKVCSFLASKSIPKYFFLGDSTLLPKELLGICGDKFAFNNAIAALRRYSLVETSNLHLYFHRLVQAVVRDGLNELERKHWTTIAGKLVNAHVPGDTWDARHWPAFENALPHAISVCGHLERDQLLPEVAGRLRNQIGDYLRSRAKFSSAQEHLQIGLKLREQALGANHPDVASSLYSLGWLYGDLGQHKRAEDLALRSLEIREKALGPDHPDTARSLNNLAVLYEAQGHYPKAEPLYRRALEIWEKALDPDHPDTARSLNNLAALYEAQGHYPKAEPLYRRALEIWEKALGPDHPDTATGLNNLAALYEAQGHYPKAEPLYRRALEISEKALGPDHPNTAASLNNLAALYQAQGHYLKAEPLYRRALEICEKALGPDHPNTATSLNNLAGLYEETRRKEKAHLLFQRALKLRQSFLTANPNNLEAARVCELSRLGAARTSDKSPLRNDEKMGRNDLCPCGSGKKFKKCGMINSPDHATTSILSSGKGKSGVEQ